MNKGSYYVKSFEEDFILKRLIGKKKTNFQTIDEIIKTRKIKPNTKSFGREKRLSCTILNKNYTKTYRAQGLIFQTDSKPDYIAPFDFLLLSDAKKIIVQYYRIQNNLHLYYNHQLIPGFEKFIFNDFKKLVEEIPSPKIAWEKINKFRKEAGHRELPKSKYRLVEYNEVVFHKPFKIKPIAIFGYKKEAKEIARKYDLPHYRSAKIFYKSLK